MKKGGAASQHPQEESRVKVLMAPEQLHKHGFCCSYAEVVSFERNAAKVQDTDLQRQNDLPRFVQNSADNVDHNIRTLDRNGTFHGMGIIGSITPGVKVSNHIPRENVTNKDISAAGQILIIFHKKENNGMSVANSIINFLL